MNGSPVERRARLRILRYTANYHLLCNDVERVGLVFQHEEKRHARKCDFYILFSVYDFLRCVSLVIGFQLYM